MALKRWCLFFGFGIITLGLWAQSEKKEFDYGLRLYGEGLYDVAALQFDRFLKDYPQSPLSGRAAFLLGESLFKQKKFQEARQAYWTLLVRYPDCQDAAEAQYRFGECVENMGEAEVAIQAYQRIYSFFPQSPFAARGLYRAGRLALRAGRLAEAESLLKTLLQSSQVLQEIRTPTSLLLSDVLAAGNRYAEAEAALRPLMDQPVALIRLARLAIDQGAFEKAEKHLEGVIQKSKDDSLLQVARFLMGDLMVFQAKIDPALNHYRLAAKGPDPVLQRRVRLRIGELELSRERFDYALASYQALSDVSPSDTLYARIAIGKARAQYGLGRFSAARETLHPILMGAFSEADRKEARLLDARILGEEKSDASALAVYLALLHEYPNDEFTPWILFQAARIEIERLGHITSGLFHLQTLWERYPRHRLVPEARYLYAIGLEKVRRFEEARQVLIDLVRQYPGSPWAETVSQRLEGVYGVRSNKIFPTGLRRPLPLFLGDYLAGTWFDFPAAIAAYRQADMTEDSVAFRIGRAYAALFMLDPNPAWKDSAKAFFKRQNAQGITSPDDVKAELGLIELAETPPAERLRRYRRLERTIPSEAYDRFTLLWGRTAMACDSIDRALSVLARSGDPEADYWMAMAWYKKGDLRKAVERLDRYLTRDAPHYTPEALLIRARCHVSQGEDTLAVTLLERVLDRYGYAHAADSAAFFLGRLYLKKNRSQAAIRLYHEWIARAREQERAARVGWMERAPAPSMIAEAFFGLGRGLEAEGRYPEAKSAYFEVLRRGPDLHLKNRVLKALGRIAEAEGHFGKAAEYEEAVSSSDSSLYRIGQLKMKEKKYGEAARTFMAAINAGPPPNLSVWIYRDLAISFLRQGQISHAESARLALEKNHAKVQGVEEALVEVEIEKGMAYLEKKEFPLALECFDRVKKKWKKGPWSARAELETGRVLLIMNQTEKALDLLTKMALQYPNDPIIDRVYLNLGDHYFRSQQFENALEAFRKVVDSRKDPEIRPLGMRYLIRTYESLGMFDAAIALTRRYLSEYPDAEDALQKKVQIGLNAMQLKAYDLALTQFRSVQWESDPETEAEIQYWIGKCYAEMGRWLEAIQEFLRVKYVSKPTRLPWASTALFEAARIYERLSDPTRARSLYEKILQAEGRTSDLGRVAQQKIDELSPRPEDGAYPKS